MPSGISSVFDRGLRNLRRQTAFVTPACFWILALLTGSLLPQSAKIALGTSTPDGQAVVARFVWIRGLLPYAAFGSTALLLLAISRKSWQRRTALLMTVALGAGIEFIQHFPLWFRPRVDRYWPRRPGGFGRLSHLARYAMAEPSAASCIATCLPVAFICGPVLPA